MTKGRGGHVLATVLFTDIVDSSRLARELGDRRWRVLLARHHDVVRRALKRWHGREVDNAGDGFFATFDDQANAIRCACSISDGVRELGIEVRAGCHVGQAELIGRKLSGVTVHVGARVMSLAGPSEVLVSSMLKDLVPASGFGLEDRGEHALKGIDGAWRLFAVTSVDGQPRSGALAPEVAAERLASIEPLPLTRRRWGRTVVVSIVAVVALVVSLVVASRPDPVEVIPESLVRIDPHTNEIVASIPVSKPGAAQLAIVPPHEVWVLGQPEQVISIVDADSNMSVGSVPVQRGQTSSLLTGFGLVYGADRVWVAPRQPSNVILAVDPRLRDIEETMRVAGNTGRLAFGAGLLWVPVAPGGRHWEVEGIDPLTGEEAVRARTGLDAYNVAYGEGAAWVSNYGDSSVTKIDPSSGEAVTIDLGGLGQPSGIGIGFQSVWVSDTLNGLVYRIDPATDQVIDEIRIADISQGYQSDIAVFEESVWVTSPETKTLVRIDPSTDRIVGRIPLPFAPQDLIVGYGSIWVTVVTSPI
jgi:class 3 adenylate cyclase